MTLTKKLVGTELDVAVQGRVDTVTAPEFEQGLKGSIEGVTLLVLDCEKLDYISSAGLRVLLSLQKIMSKQGKMVLRNVNESVNEVFEVTGFSDILTIE